MHSVSMAWARTARVCFALALAAALIACQPGGASVSDLLAARDSGEVGSRQVRLSGYWSSLGGGHSCAPPMAPPGELEIYCHDGEFGITEWNEPIAVLTADFRMITTQGPHLTPWLSDDHWRRLGGPSQDRPARITVLGHFDDPRAKECQPDAVQLCRDRFVIDEIVEFRPR